MKQLISIIIPVFNEEDNVQITYDELKTTTNSLDEYDFEFIFTDNHSTDQTFSKLSQIAQTDSNVRVARFARNFGFQKSVLTGYLLARGAAAIQIDADLQDPPSMFGPFLAKWKEGHDVVVGVRGQRHEGALLYHGRRLYYRLMIKLAGEHLIADAGDFRLIDRTIIEKIRQVDDVHIYLRGLISSLSRNQTGVHFDRQKRMHNESKFRIRSLMAFALDGIMAHSSLPLRIAFYIGLLTAGGSVLLGAFYLLNRLFGADSGPEGFATTQILILLGIGLNGLFLGVIGAYIGRIYDEVRSRHTVVISDVLNFDDRIDAVERSIRIGPLVES
ncbi:MAG: glycosyltransferase family 2 protein [Candidatus Devosia symbiotica]|nr:glycosyltransferase family 2 protein [Candidatus Devosia symbiotica]